MSYTLVQSASANAGTVALGSNTTAGNMLLAVFSSSTATTSITPTDGTGSNYVSQVTGAAANAVKLWGFTAFGIAGGAVTINQTNNGSVGNVYIAEYSGLGTTVMGTNSNIQSGSGTVFTLSSGNITTTASAMIWGAAYVPNTPGASAGVGFGNVVSAWSTLTVEDQSQSSSGSFAATWSSGVANEFATIQCIAMAIALPTPPVFLPYSTTQFFVQDQVIQF